MNKPCPSIKTVRECIHRLEKLLVILKDGDK
jgi:hypothetical protein